jgi:hypothetical protein
VKAVPVIQDLLRVDKRLVEASINATATGVKPARVGGEKVWIVEGIEAKGSVDWVTEAGAGGRVAEVLEARIQEGNYVGDALDTLDDDSFAEWMKGHRVELTEAFKKKEPPAADPDDSEKNDDDKDPEDELEKMIAKLVKQGKSRAQAEAMAKVSVAKMKESTHQEGDEVADISTETLVEALASEQAQTMISEAISSALPEAIRSLNLGAEVQSLVEARLDEDREVFKAEADARARRGNQVRDLRDHAHNKIDESSLHPRLKESVKMQFDLVEGAPTPALDLVDDEDADGKVVKTAEQKLDEALQSAITEGLALQAELGPKTRITGQGPRVTEAAGEDGKTEEQQQDRLGPATRSLLEGVGIKEPDLAYERQLGD